MPPRMAQIPLVSLSVVVVTGLSHVLGAGLDALDAKAEAVDHRLGRGG